MSTAVEIVLQAWGCCMLHDLKCAEQALLHAEVREWCVVQDGDVPLPGTAAPPALQWLQQPLPCARSAAPAA